MFYLFPFIEIDDRYLRDLSVRHICYCILASDSPANKSDAAAKCPVERSN